MKRFLGPVFAAVAASCLTAAAHSASATDQTTRTIRASTQNLAVHRPLHRGTSHHWYPKHPALVELAPGDQYFGPLGLSIIGIANTIRDTGRRYDVDHDIAVQTYKSAELTERAIRDWAKKYPHDDQLPRAIYFLQRLYTKVLYQPSRDRAALIAAWLFSDFGSSPQAKQLHKTLAFQHLAPIPTAPVAAKPSYSSAFGSAYPSVFAGPGTAPQAVATARPDATAASPVPLPRNSASPAPLPTASSTLPGR